MNGPNGGPHSMGDNIRHMGQGPNPRMGGGQIPCNSVCIPRVFLSFSFSIYIFHWYVPTVFGQAASAAATCCGGRFIQICLLNSSLADDDDICWMLKRILLTWLFYWNDICLLSVDFQITNSIDTCQPQSISIASNFNWFFFSSPVCKSSLMWLTWSSRLITFRYTLGRRRRGKGGGAGGWFFQRRLGGKLHKIWNYCTSATFLFHPKFIRLQQLWWIGNAPINFPIIRLIAVDIRFERSEWKIIQIALQRHLLATIATLNKIEYLEIDSKLEELTSNIEYF